MVRLLGAAAVAVVLVLLWLMPGVLFPHPDTNAALELAALGPLLYLITLGASLLSLVGVAVVVPLPEHEEAIKPKINRTPRTAKHPIAPLRVASGDGAGGLGAIAEAPEGGRHM